MCLFFAGGENITNSAASYNGQVFIGNQSDQPEQNYAYINLGGKLLPICIDNTDLNFPAIGDSFCRQLGYTEISIENVMYVLHI